MRINIIYLCFFGIFCNIVQGSLVSDESFIQPVNPNVDGSLVKPVDFRNYFRIKTNAKWEPYKPHENPFGKWSKEDIRSMFNAELDFLDEMSYSPELEILDHVNEEPMPNEFDSRKTWPNCLRGVRTQGKCGACWAFAATNVLSDRLCIASNEKIKVALSPQDLVSCEKNNNGCHGGKQDLAWKYLEETGSVTDQCFKFNSTYHNEPQCLENNKCSDETVKYQKYKASKGKSKPLKCPHEIQHEILKNGPVGTGFIVAEDFMHYKSGIYHYTDGELLGGHAVKILGWGKEAGVDFWIVENSWGPDWGENGYFRIQFGQLYIDSNAYTGYAGDQQPLKYLK